MADNSSYCEPLALYACRTGDLATLRRQLLSEPAIARRRYLCPVSQNEITLLSVAAREGHSDCLQVLIDHGANEFNAALCTAAEHGHSDCLKVLVEQPARRGLVLRHDDDGIQFQANMIPGGADNLNEALITAAMNGRSDCLRYLVAQGADQLNIALWSAAEGGYRQCLEILLDGGAKQLDVALRIAVTKNHEHCWQLLVDAGADPLIAQWVQGLC